MTGKILIFDPDSGSGIVRAKDGKRYEFNIKEFKSQGIPTAGMAVSMDIKDDAAASIFVMNDKGAKGAVENKETASANARQQIPHGDPDETVSFTPDVNIPSPETLQEFSGPEGSNAPDIVEKTKNAFLNVGQKILHGDPNVSVSSSPGVDNRSAETALAPQEISEPADGKGSDVVGKTKNVFSNIGQKILHGDPNVSVSVNPEVDNRSAETASAPQEISGPAGGKGPEIVNKKKNVFSNIGQKILHGDPNISVSVNPGENDPLPEAAPVSAPQEEKAPKAEKRLAKPAERAKPLHKCADCGSKVSNRAEACPKCGGPVARCVNCRAPLDLSIDECSACGRQAPSATMDNTLGGLQIPCPKCNGVASTPKRKWGCLLLFPPFWGPLLMIWILLRVFPMPMFLKPTYACGRCDYTFNQ